jgi:hypothetical protein
MARFAGADRRAHVDFGNPAGFAEAIEHLESLAAVSNQARARRLTALADGYRSLRDAIATEPTALTDEEVLWRYAGGEISDVTARKLMGCGASGLFEACARLGLPIPDTDDVAG